MNELTVTVPLNHYIELQDIATRVTVLEQLINKSTFPPSTDEIGAILDINVPKKDNL